MELPEIPIGMEVVQVTHNPVRHRMVVDAYDPRTRKIFRYELVGSYDRHERTPEAMMPHIDVSHIPEDDAEARERAARAVAMQLNQADHQYAESIFSQSRSLLRRQVSMIWGEGSSLAKRFIDALDKESEGWIDFKGERERLRTRDEFDPLRGDDNVPTRAELRLDER